MTPTGKKVLGIIAEYNPFHNGHHYHIEEAKRQSGCDYVIVVMSGDFVQRGTPALLDKYTRAEFALRAGADIVLELPVALACGSAEYFARGAVGILHRLGIVDTLCFGCEQNDLNALSQLASVLENEPVNYQERLQELLRSGYSFPQARQEALSTVVSSGITALLETPNNILAVEYLRALQYFASDIQPLAIQRIGSSYHEITLNSPETTDVVRQYPSATSIRRFVKDHANHSFAPLADQVPDYVYQHMTGDSFSPLYEDDFSDMLYHAILTHPDLTIYQDVSSELADRIEANLHDSFHYSELATALLSKGYTATRVNRALAHILLGISTEDMIKLRDLSYAPYARILGIKKESSHLLRSVSEDDRIPLITKIADAKHLLSPEALRFLQQDITAAELYNQVIYRKYKHRIPSDYFYRFPVL